MWGSLRAGPWTYNDRFRGRRCGPPLWLRVFGGPRRRAPMRTQLPVGSVYGTIVPWMGAAGGGAIAIAVPDAFRLTRSVALEITDGAATAEFVAVEGARDRLV